MTRYDEIYRGLDGLTALAVAEHTTMGKERDERDTAFVKRIVATYFLMSERAALAPFRSSILSKDEKDVA